MMRVSLAVLALILAATASAYADDGFNAKLGQPTKAEALAHLSKGNGLYKIFEFEAAIDEYKAGSLVEPAGVFQFNLGQAYRQLANYERAIWHYERFLAMRQPTGDLREKVEGFIATMKAEMEKAASRKEPTEPGAAPGTPTPDNSSAQANAPVLHDQRDGPARKTSSSWMTGRRKIAIAVGAAGLLSAGAGIVFGIRAKNFEEDSDKLCPEVQCNQADEANRLLERGQDSALYANVAFGVGAAALIGAAVLWFTGSPTNDEVSVHALMQPDTVGAGVSGRF